MIKASMLSSVNNRPQKLGSSATAGLVADKDGFTLDLSGREIEVMQWLKIGKTNHEIACILNISACTVKNHLQRIFRKLAVFNRTHAVAKFFIVETTLKH